MARRARLIAAVAATLATVASMAGVPAGAAPTGTLAAGVTNNSFDTGII